MITLTSNTRLPEEFWELKRRKIKAVRFRRKSDEAKRRLIEQWGAFCRMHQTANPELTFSFEWIVDPKGVTIRQKEEKEEEKEEVEEKEQEPPQRKVEAGIQGLDGIPPMGEWNPGA